MAAITQKLSDEVSSTVVSSTNSITLRISKFNPKTDSSATFVEFNVPVQKWTTVLDVILTAKQHLDPSIAVRYSCRQASCGSCGMKINGKPALACYTKILELNSNVVTVEPMNNFPILRDLAVDFTQFFSAHKKLKPYIIRDDSEVTEDTKEFLQTPDPPRRHCLFQPLQSTII